MTFGEKLKQIRKEKDMSQQEFADMLNTSKQVISRYELGQTTPKISVAAKYCQKLGVNLDNMLNDEKSDYDISRGEYDPTVTKNVVTFPVIREMAAGHERMDQENWSGDTVEIPVPYLHGRPPTDFIVLTISGNSMYPLYMDGDIVMILRQSTLNRSGDIGLVRYHDGSATLKKVEYGEGEDWMKLIPVNPEYQPKIIKGEDVKRYSIMGIPKLVVREI